MLHKSDGSGTPAGRRALALLLVPARRGLARVQRAGKEIHPSLRAFPRTLSVWLDTDAMVQPCSVR